MGEARRGWRSTPGCPPASRSPELQLRELRDYADRRGFAVHREYVDQASGDVRRRQRAPEFDALMADARRRRFDCVLVWKYDRFARSLGALIAALAGVPRPRRGLHQPHPGHRHHHAHGPAVLPRHRLLCRVRTRGDRRAGAGRAGQRARQGQAPRPARARSRRTGPRRRPQGRGAEPAPDRRPGAPFSLRACARC